MSRTVRFGAVLAAVAFLIQLALSGVSGAAADAAEGTPPDLQWRSDSRCGPNCLYVLLFMYGMKPDYDVLISETNLTDRGVSVVDLVGLAGEFGLPVVPLRAKVGALADFPLPAIVHCRGLGRDVGYYLLLLSVNKDDTFTVLNGTTGKMQRLLRGDFYDRWSGVILVRSDRWEERNPDGLLLVCSGVLLAVLLLTCVWGWRCRAAARQVT